jgi:alkylation response protein AidB-like acyl-CoA dehydrogenase
VPAGALLGDKADALPAIEKVVDYAIAAMASEATGCMQVLLDTTIAYTRQRIQFGKPLADNQVLRHRMASMAVRIEEARASALNAVLMADADPVTRPGGAVCCGAGGAAARRHGCHRGAERRRLFQAFDGDRNHLRLAGVSSETACAAVASGSSVNGDEYGPVLFQGRARFPR